MNEVILAIYVSFKWSSKDIILMFFYLDWTNHDEYRELPVLLMMH